MGHRRGRVPAGAVRRAQQSQRKAQRGLGRARGPPVDGRELNYRGDLEESSRRTNLATGPWCRHIDHHMKRGAAPTAMPTGVVVSARSLEFFFTALFFFFFLFSQKKKKKKKKK